MPEPIFSSRPSNGSGRRFGSALAVGLAGLILVAACTVSGPNQSGGATSSAAKPSPAASIQATIPSPVPPASGATGPALDAARVAKILVPAVGEVIVNTRSGIATGSGFVVSHGPGVSYMVTNNHVIEGAQKIQVLMPDGSNYVVQLQGTDPIEDIAVLRIPDESLPLAQFADSTKLLVGQPVVAIGSPFRNESSVTAGILSALHRRIDAGTPTSSETLKDTLQTDAAINPGNSGGPLADAEGHVIGVNTAGQSGGVGIGFAIPSVVAKRIADDLIAGRRPGHPFIGISYDDEADALARGRQIKGFGIYVTDVVRNCPAERSGLQPGDIIQIVDGQSLNNGQTLGGVLSLHEPGDRIQIQILRGSERRTIELTLVERPIAGSTC